MSGDSEFPPASVPLTATLSPRLLCHDKGVPARCRLLIHNLIQYVIDNVFVLMLASSISLVGTTVIDKTEAPYLVIAVLGVVVSTAITVGLRAAVLWAHTKSGTTGKAIARHMLRQLSWFVRVAFQAFSAALLKFIFSALASSEDDPCRKVKGSSDTCGRTAGYAFLASIAMFLIFFQIAIRLMYTLQAHKTFSSIEASLRLFLGECAYLSFLIGASVSLHHGWALAADALRGSVSGSRLLWARLVEVAMLTLLGNDATSPTILASATLASATLALCR